MQTASPEGSLVTDHAHFSIYVLVLDFKQTKFQDNLEYFMVNWLSDTLPLESIYIYH